MRNYKQYDFAYIDCLVASELLHEGTVLLLTVEHTHEDEDEAFSRTQILFDLVAPLPQTKNIENYLLCTEKPQKL